MSTNREIKKAVVTAIDHYMPVHRIGEDLPQIEIDSWFVENESVITVDAYDGDEDIRIHIEVSVERGV